MCTDATTENKHETTTERLDRLRELALKSPIKQPEYFRVVSIATHLLTHF